ncbi:MAG TPA: hypothetical protein VMD79_12060 [Solirubrobacteraceae bacterium]|nr:hypothetical protein [Solirubrobacteraceae bacterium]
MRPALLKKPRGQRRGARRQRTPHTPAAVQPAQLAGDPPLEQAPRACDPAVERVREAGGPVDHASYACACGYLFRAAVSTSVSCPNCGTDQAW